MTMAGLLAKQEQKTFKVTRGQQLTGKIISISSSEVILDFGIKSEGILSRKELSKKQLEGLKIGDNLDVFVVGENDSGQIIVALKRQSSKLLNTGEKWNKFQKAFEEDKVLTGVGIEVNKGGLVVEISGARGFLPSSQVTLSQASNLEELIGKEIPLTVIEVDPSQNRLIFSQKTTVSEETKVSLDKLKPGDKISGEVAAVLPFGIFVTLPGGVEGLVHISEIAWEKVEDPSKLFKVGDKVEAKVIASDSNTNRVSLSLKQLLDDPFVEVAKKYSNNDVVKGQVSKVSGNGILVTLEDPTGELRVGGAEGLIPQAKLTNANDYKLGERITVLIDNIDVDKRRITLSPFITTTKGLIYK